MSREIKFRAWHKKQSKMIYDVQKTEMVHHAMSSWSGEPSGLDHYFDEEWYELMQYTGLTDRNGQEIYEGDIIRSGLSTAVVEWYDDIDQDFYWGNACGFIFNFDPETMSPNGDYEVIGNILEGLDK
jgi:uncharacterized phage protein (TIGR01671 family)